MMLFRADKRKFGVGDAIVSAGEFSRLNPDGSDDVERVFESLRPLGKPARLGSLFLFEDERSARKHWSKMTGGILYEVAVGSGGALHKGDMQLVDLAYGVRNDSSALEELAIRYWEGELTANPVVEVLVQSATIIAVISDDEQERLSYFKSWALPPAQLFGDRSSFV